MIWPHLWFCRVLLFMHADRGCALAPGLPCALLFLRVFATQASGAFRAAGMRYRDFVAVTSKL